MSKQLIQQYYSKVEKLIRYGGTRNESSLRKAFLELLDHYAHSKGLELIPELEYRTPLGNVVYPDGTLKDALRQDWGFWESKDEKDVLADEIEAKFAKGYPASNILFEDTQTAVLYQNDDLVMRAEFGNAEALDQILTLFVSFEPKEVTDFRQAIQQFNADVPGLAEELRAIIHEQIDINQEFKQTLQEFLELTRQAINPKIEMADVREMIIQHVLTEDIFMRVFDEADFHRENAIAQKLQEVAQAFYSGATKRNIHHKIAPYYETINARAAQISDHHEKQKFLKALYENFYKAYNPKAADRLGIVYTPDEIVRFMIESADHLVYKHFGKTLGDQGVEILDPATGTGTFITELIEYLPSNQLEYKYKHEIHCNEVSILPYYIANLNIEYTYKQKMGQFMEFENICFVDTLDNLGFEHTGAQMNFFGMVDENIERINRQNTRKISVVIGNPPYNANQMNENENNKNREYPEIDKRIKDTYIKHSTAQKTKLYDMYARFLRWASDRLSENGVIAFVSNNSFIDSRSYDGFRKVVANEFNEIYIVDLKGDARTSGPRRQREGGNVFNDQIRVGIAVYFLVRKKEKGGCKIYYNAIDDYVRSPEKLDYLRDNRIKDLQFKLIHPDKDNNWLNQVENPWDDLIPIGSKRVKFGTGRERKQAIFKLYSLGVVTNRDDWVYDFNKGFLTDKVKFLIDIYNKEVDFHLGLGGDKPDSSFLDYTIKWTRAVKNSLARGDKFSFSSDVIRDCNYRPFVKNKLYFSQDLNEMQYQVPAIFPDPHNLNLAIAIDVSSKPFSILAIDKTIDLHFIGDTQIFPFYRYSETGERVENITDWALKKFQDHYHKAVSKEDIFHYVYAVLHHSSYREKYKINLKREFPHIPFYDGFEQWVVWGKALMNLHLNYETVEIYPLEREDVNPEISRKAYKALLIARKARGVIEIDTLTTLHNVPDAAWDYRLGNRSAIEWVLERYKERKPKDPTILEKFNTYKFKDYKEEVIELIARVTTVSVETMRIVDQMSDN